MSEYPIIPLFPLAVVVFPDQTLPLHIFEPRYRELIADCRAAETANGLLPFGISFGHDVTVEREVGCTVVLEKVLTEYEDGQLDILTTGRDRYRIAEIFEDKPYLTAAVEFFTDEEEVADTLLLEKVREGYEQLSSLIEVESGMRLEHPTPEHSFPLALSAGLPPEVRQELLEMRSENLRLQRIEAHFETLIPELEEHHKEERRVRSNGKTKKI
jgi:Lon protease-like protein